MKVEVHPEAEKEFAEAKKWYGQRSRLAARAFVTEISNAIREVTTSPTRWAKIADGPRRFVLSRFPFAIIYRVESEKIIVLAIAHQRRLPGYWRERR